MFLFDKYTRQKWGKNLLYGGRLVVSLCGRFVGRSRGRASVGASCLDGGSGAGSDWVRTQPDSVEGVHENRPPDEVVVVGAGLGGSMAALALVERGLRVLLIETGGADAAVAPPPRGSRFRRVLRRLVFSLGAVSPDRWPDPILLYRRRGNRRPRLTMAAIGCGLGGSSAVYSAALGRMRREDFATDRRGAPGDPQPLPNAWPVSFDEFRPYYRRAESILRVVGERDPLDPDDDSAPGRPPRLSPRDASLVRTLERNGAHPYRLRVGFDYRPGCDECIGRRCPVGCKAEGASRALSQARAQGGLVVETCSTALMISRDDTGPNVVVRTRAGRIETRSAAAVVVAAGALNTPLLLARSDSLWGERGRPPLLGRGLMFHFSDLFAVRVARGLERGRVKKSIAVRDLYDPATGGLGEVQSVGCDLTTAGVMTGLRERGRAYLPPGCIRLVELLRPAVWLLARICGPVPVLATIAEDLPYAENRVVEEGADPDAGRPGRIAIHYSVTPGQKSAAARRRAAIRRLFSPMRVAFLSPAVAPNLGHPMGTCRMGTDPATSVVDGEGRVWGCPGVYVADASAFPSSGGVGPSLTVAAHALRVGDTVARDLAIAAGAVATIIGLSV